MDAISTDTKAVVVDIEGTIASLTFVKEVLFPYAAKKYGAYVAALDMSQQANLQEDLAQSPFYEGQPLGSEEFIVAALAEFTAKDYKDTTLKSIQGEIWREGYRSGQLKAPLYDDAKAFFDRCCRSQLPLYSYSSGSVAAQELFYQFNDHGDLRPYFEGYFDTTLGDKKVQASYTALCAAISRKPEEVVFYSDHSGEIAAAQAAGLVARLVQRGRCEGHSGGDSVAGSIADFTAQLL